MWYSQAENNGKPGRSVKMKEGKLFAEVQDQSHK